ncbi:MAG: ribonuclease [Lachnospiraceae bacterium]|nr:ribonuclease [Lachnospiraceae bacterium]
MKKRRVLGIFLVLLMLIMAACGVYEDAAPENPQGYESEEQGQSPENGEFREDVTNDKLPVYGEYYYDLTNVVLYLEVYDELPPNYITKSEARQLGWEGGSVEKYREGAAIGGDSFGNREGLLPEAEGRNYTECDIDTNGYGSRGSRRLVFSDDGLYFYTSDHYETFSEVTVTKEYEVIW